MPTYRVTYRPIPGCHWLLEDIEADDYRVRNGMHVLAQVVPVLGLPRWVCRLRVAQRDASVSHVASL